MKKIVYLLSIIAIVIFASCEREASIIESPDNVNVNGIWDVTAYIDTMAISTSFTLQTLVSTSQNGSDSIVISDSKDEFWSFKVKAALKEDGTFETKLSRCESRPENIGIIVSNGKIINKSIYFEIQFEDDVTPFHNVYKLKGERN
jgi:hypothetical protein